MRRVFLILFLMIFSAKATFAYEVDYRRIYINMEVPTFSYMHGIDPGEYYDNKDAAYSTYPLFRLVSPVYFKSVTIVPGYYNLTPVMYKGEPYILFKECGLVKYILPVYKKEVVPEGFYESHIPQPKLTFMQKTSKNFYSYVGKHFPKAKRKEPKQSYLEVEDLDLNFVSMVVYYGNYRYYTILRTVKM